MEIRRAGEKDLDMVLKLLSEVLEIHAKIRPDIFISGTTKYNREELKAIFRDEKTPVYVAVDEKDQVMGYAFCMIKNQPKSDNLVPYRSIYIDDLCVDESWRGHHVGEALFDFVREEARRMGCYEITLNVWEGNDSARKFYDRMGLKPQKTQMELILK